MIVARGVEFEGQFPYLVGGARPRETLFQSFHLEGLREGLRVKGDWRASVHQFVEEGNGDVVKRSRRHREGSFRTPLSVENMRVTG